MYGKLPSYRAMFEREGVEGPADLAIVGSAAEVEDGIAGLAAAGVTDFAPSEYCLQSAARRYAHGAEKPDFRRIVMKLKTLGPEAQVKDVLAALEEAGAVIVKDVVDTDTVDQFNEEVIPLSIEHPWGEMTFRAERRSVLARWRLVRQLAGT